MELKRITDVVYAALYFSALSFFAAHIISAQCAGRCAPEVLIAVGFALILISVLLITFTRLLVSCVFIAVIGLSIEIAGLRAQPFDSEIAWGSVLAPAMLTVVIVLVNIKAHRAPLWAAADFRIH